MSQITELASKLFNPKSEFHPKIVPTERRVRGLLNGHIIFDTTSAHLVWEHRFFPQYWIPKSDFTSLAHFEEDKPVSGIDSSTSTLTTTPKPTSPTSPNSSIQVLTVPSGFDSPLANLVRVDFKSLDAWFEEQSEILYHPKDPFHRVDILPSGRHVKVEIDGVVLADTVNEGGVMSLWETNFPGRWYLPRTAVNWALLTPSDTKTGCPYKGEASYYNAIINGKEHKDVVWWYPNPTQESASVTGMLCFYPDKVTTVVDGKDIAKIGMPNLKEITGKDTNGQ